MSRIGKISIASAIEDEQASPEFGDALKGKVAGRLYGAAARSLQRALMDDPYRSDWDEQHKRISEYHRDDFGHVVCGCGIHQAFCPTCYWGVTRAGGGNDAVGVVT